MAERLPRLTLQPTGRAPVAGVVTPAGLTAGFSR
jgi:hypothetical protein